MQYRKGPDGKLIGRMGKNSPVPDGYTRSEKYPHIFEPILVECNYRTLVTINTTCCGVSVRTFCKVLDTTISRELCQSCQANLNWIENWKLTHKK